MKRLKLMATTVVLSTALLSTAIYADAPSPSGEIAAEQGVAENVQKTIEIEENVAEVQKAVLDNTPPQISNFGMDRTTVKPGETITFTVKVTDDSGVAGRPHIGISSPSDSLTTYSFYMDPVGDGIYKASYTFSENDIAGTWTVTWVSVDDIYGNHSQYGGGEHFVLTNAVPDKKGPAVQAFSMDKKEVKPGERITFTVKITDESGVASYPSVGISVPNDSLTTFRAKLYPKGDGIYEGSYVIPANAVNGRYNLTWVSANDLVGNSTVYSLREYFTVTGGNQDNVPPVISNFTMSKTQVHSGDTIVFTVTIKDPSGLKADPTLGISKPNYSLTEYTVTLKEGKDDTYTGTYTIPENAVVGKYPLTWISAVDKPGNESLYSFSGVSFTVLPDEHVHTIVADEEIQPTCTEDGLSSGTHCSECGEILKEQTVIPAVGHVDRDDDGYCDQCEIQLREPETPEDPEKEPEENPGEEPGENPDKPEVKPEDPQDKPEVKPDDPQDKPEVKPGRPADKPANQTASEVKDTGARTESSKNQNTTVNTGDSSHRMLWAVVFLADLIALIGLVWMKRKSVR